MGVVNALVRKCLWAHLIWKSALKILGKNVSEVFLKIKNE